MYINSLDKINAQINDIKLTTNICNFNTKEFIEFKCKDEKTSDKLKELRKILEVIFNYKLFTSDGKNKSSYNKDEDKSKEWGAYKLLKELDITTCPYCNRNYIHTYINKSGMCRADIDHFYPKSKYPFLAVSLYNFIPSCHTCNSSFKNSIDTFLLPHVYPYNEGFEDMAKLKTSFYSDKDKKGMKTDENLKDSDKYDISYLLGNSDNFNIELEIWKDICSDGQAVKIQNSIESFHMEHLYNLHKDYIRELIKKSIIYNESRIDEIYNQYPELFTSRDELVQMIVTNYIESKDLDKRPLAKLTKDISEELGLK